MTTATPVIVRSAIAGDPDANPTEIALAPPSAEVRHRVAILLAKILVAQVVVELHALPRVNK